MTDQTIVGDPPDEELDEELLPGGPGPEDNHAVAVLETVKPTENGDAWAGDDEDGDSGDDFTSAIAQPPKKSRTRTRRRPPANLGDPILTVPVVLKLVSVGKGVANITATLGVETAPPVNVADIMGEHAYAGVFRGDYLGEGIIVRDEATKVDAENERKQSFKLNLPRWNNGVDQISTYVLPLLPDEANLDGLLGISPSWRLNVNVEIPGELRLHPQQQSLDLTSKAE